MTEHMNHEGVAPLPLPLNWDDLDEAAADNLRQLVETETPEYTAEEARPVVKQAIVCLDMAHRRRVPYLAGCSREERLQFERDHARLARVDEWRAAERLAHGERGDWDALTTMRQHAVLVAEFGIRVGIRGFSRNVLQCLHGSLISDLRWVRRRGGRR